MHNDWITKELCQIFERFALGFGVEEGYDQDAAESDTDEDLTLSERAHLQSTQVEMPLQLTKEIFPSDCSECSCSWGDIRLRTC